MIFLIIVSNEIKPLACYAKAIDMNGFFQVLSLRSDLFYRSERAHAAASPLQIRLTSLGSGLMPPCGQLGFVSGRNISFNYPLQKERHDLRSCLSFWVSLPLVAPPFGISMLGRSEFALRQGFRHRRKRLYGASAPPARRPVLTSPGQKDVIRPILFWNNAGQNERHPPF